MRFTALILMIGFFHGVSAQEKIAFDCRDVGILQKKLWKHYMGTEQWQATMDSVLQICPNSASLWGDRGMAHMLRGQYAEGMAYFEKAAELDPFYYLGSKAWYRITYLHDYEGAIADFDQLEKNAGYSLVYVTSMHMSMLKGLCYKELGNHEKALELYNIAIEEQISKKGIEWVGVYDFLFRGVLKYQTKDYDGAIDDLNKAIKQYETLADNYYYRGMALVSVGRKEEGRADLQRAKDLILGGGQKRNDNVAVLIDEIFLADIDNALVRIN